MIEAPIYIHMPEFFQRADSAGPTAVAVVFALLDYADYGPFEWSSEKVSALINLTYSGVTTPAELEAIKWAVCLFFTEYRPGWFAPCPCVFSLVSGNPGQMS